MIGLSATYVSFTPHAVILRWPTSCSSFSCSRLRKANLVCVSPISWSSSFGRSAKFDVGITCLKMHSLQVSLALLSYSTYRNSETNRGTTRSIWINLWWRTSNWPAVRLTSNNNWFATAWMSWGSILSDPFKSLAEKGVIAVDLERIGVFCSSSISVGFSNYLSSVDPNNWSGLVSGYRLYFSFCFSFSRIFTNLLY